MEAWTPTETAAWLTSCVGLPEYRGRFLEQQVDGNALLEGFSDQELKEDLGVRPIGHRKQLQWALAQLRQPAPPALPPARAGDGDTPRAPEAFHSWMKAMDGRDGEFLCILICCQ